MINYNQPQTARQQAAAQAAAKALAIKQLGMGATLANPPPKVTLPGTTSQPPPPPAPPPPSPTGTTGSSSLGASTQLGMGTTLANQPPKVTLPGTTTGTTGTTSQNPQPPPPSGTDYMDPQVRAALYRALTQDNNTPAQEQLAANQNQRATGQALADARAQAGAGGFGLSGAAQGQQSGIRSAAANQFLNQIFAIQQQAKDNQFRNLGLASDAFNSESQRQYGGVQSTQQQKFQGGQNDLDRSVQRDAIKAAVAALGGGSSTPPPSTPPASGPPDGMQPAPAHNGGDGPTGANMAGNAPQRYAAQGDITEHPDQYVETASHGNSPADTYEGSDADYDYYVSKVDGKKWKVRRGNGTGA